MHRHHHNNNRPKHKHGHKPIHKHGHGYDHNHAHHGKDDSHHHKKLLCKPYGEDSSQFLCEKAHHGHHKHAHHDHKFICDPVISSEDMLLSCKALGETFHCEEL